MASTLKATLELNDQFSSKMDRAANSQKKFNQGAAATGMATREMGSMMDRAGSQADALAMQLGKMAAAAFGAYMAFNQFKGALKEAISLSAGLDKVARNIGSLTGATEAQLGQYKDIMRDLSIRYPTAAKEIGSAIYDAVSSGFEDAGNDGLKFMAELAVKGAAAGGADPKETMALMASGLNAYYSDTKDKVDNAQRFMDVMFQTVNLGVTEFSDLAGSMGDIFGTGANVGASYEDLGAAMALMTRKGINTSESATALNRFMLAMVSPSDAAAGWIDKLGLDFNSTSIRRKGMGGVIEELGQKLSVTQKDLDAWQKAGLNEVQIQDKVNEKLGLSSQAFNDLFGDVRGYKAALALTTNEGKDYIEMLDQMKGASGATDKVVQAQSKGISYQWGIFKNIVDDIKMSIGDAILGSGPNALLPKFNGMMQYIMGTDDWKNADIPLKFHIIGLNITNKVEDWFWGTNADNLFDITTGKERLQKFGEDIGKTISTAITGFLTGDKTGGEYNAPSVFVDIGKTAVSSFITGFKEGWDWSALIPDTGVEMAAGGLLALKLGLPQKIIGWLMGGGGSGGGIAGGLGAETAGMMTVNASVVYVNGATGGTGGGLPGGVGGPGGGASTVAGEAAGAGGLATVGAGIVTKLGPLAQKILVLEIGREFFTNLMQPADQRNQMSDGPLNDLSTWFQDKIFSPYILDPLTVDGVQNSKGGNGMDMSSWGSLWDKAKGLFGGGMQSGVNDQGGVGDAVYGPILDAAPIAGTDAGNQFTGPFHGSLAGVAGTTYGLGLSAGLQWTAGWNAGIAGVRAPNVAGAPSMMVTGAASAGGPSTTYTPSHASSGLAFSGGGDVPYTGTHLLHRREMVLPASYAEVIRGMAGSRSSGGGNTVHIGTVKVAESITVRSNADIDAINAALANQIATYASNTSVYAAEG